MTPEKRTLPLSDPDATRRMGEGPSARVVLGRYRLEERLGAGGFGVVWLGWDQKLEREVAVKAIPHERGDGERVTREARAAARLNHPGIVAVYELASDDHEVYLVSELVRGRTLAELVGARAVSDRDVARIGAVLCDALEHAHARGVIHRDVKPQNVMVVADPAAGAGFAKLADFGVAHVASGEPLTRTGDVIGTLAYMAPEQAEGASVSAAADVYSLALTLYEAWTGSNPIRGRGLAATARRLGQPLPALGAQRRDLPAGLCDAVDAALDLDPEARPTPRSLRSALASAAGELEDAGGLVEPATLRRVGLPATRRTGLFRRRRETAEPFAPSQPVPLLDADPERGVLGRRRPSLERRPLVARAGARALTGAAGGALVLALLEWLAPSPPVSGPTTALAAAVLIALLPRVGWLASMLAVSGWLATAGNRPGSALLVAAAALTVGALLPRAGALWSLAAVAPLLGALALGPAFPGLAALAPTAWRRAGLAAAGAVWVLLAEALSGDTLLFGPPGPVPPPAGWEGSLSAAAADALSPLASSPMLLTVVVWAVAAAVLPLVLRGRWLALDVMGAGLWALAYLTAMTAVGDAVAGSAVLDQARGGVAGALVAAFVAVAVSQTVPAAEGWRPQPVTTS